MKRFVLILMLCLLPCTAVAGPELANLHLEATLSPPHNEPVIGDRVARYRVQAGADVRWGRVQWEPTLNAWGVNRWRTSEVVGHFPDSWGNSDWSIERWRVSMTHNLSLHLTDHVALTTEYYMPFDRKSWGGHGLERHYYWLIGMRWSLK